jgi:hypothetical protein
MNINRNKLALRRQSIRALSPSQLSVANGGRGTSTGTSTGGGTGTGRCAVYLP